MLIMPQAAASAAAAPGSSAEKSHDGAAEQVSGYAAMAVGESLKPFTYVRDPLGSDEVDIAVTHNGVCHSDLHMRNNDWGITTFPFIGGHEVVGKVVRVGDAVSGLQPGERVGVGWVRNSCRRCRQCLRGYENLCVKGYEGTIVGHFGGFQQELRVPADFTYKIPEAIRSADAAPLLCAGITVFAPLRAHFRGPGTRVAVLGIGGLGHLALQFAAAMGADVTAIDVYKDKEAEAARLGAHQFLTPDEAYERRRAHFDIVLNAASAFIDAGKLLGMLRADGVLVQLGIPGGNPLISVPLQDVVFNQKKLSGSIVGGRADMLDMLEFAALHGIKPMVEEMPVSKINEAFERVASGAARYRVVLVSNQAEAGKAA